MQNTLLSSKYYLLQGACVTVNQASPMDINLDSTKKSLSLVNKKKNF